MLRARYSGSLDGFSKASTESAAAALVGLHLMNKGVLGECLYYRIKFRFSQDNQGRMSAGCGQFFPKAKQ